MDDLEEGGVWLEAEGRVLHPWDGWRRRSTVPVGTRKQVAGFRNSARPAHEGLI